MKLKHGSSEEILFHDEQLRITLTAVTTPQQITIQAGAVRHMIYKSADPEKLAGVMDALAKAVGAEAKA